MKISREKYLPLQYINQEGISSATEVVLKKLFQIKLFFSLNNPFIINLPISKVQNALKAKIFPFQILPVKLTIRQNLMVEYISYFQYSS